MAFLGDGTNSRLNAHL